MRAFRRFVLANAAFALGLALFATAPGCRRDAASGSGDASPSVPPPSPATSLVSGDATTASDAGLMTAEVDLLRYTGSSLAVSSNVDNPRDFPEHLVDGRSDTAWNGRSGDLVGAWIGVKVPEGARVTRIEMNAGFDKKNADGDLFTMNHRIKRVRVRRGATVVREHTFDVDVRTPQSIPVDAKGGTFRIEILETVPGTKTAWREACVSELRVIGRVQLGAALRPSAATVGIGAFRSESPAAVKKESKDQREPSDSEKAVAPLFARTWPSVSAFCKAWDAAIGPFLESRVDSGDDFVPIPHKCHALGPIGTGFVTTADVKSITRVMASHENWTEERIAVETAGGFSFPEEGVIESKSFHDPGCFGSTTTTVQVVRTTGTAVDITLGKSWTKARYTFDEDSGKPDGTMSFDDVARIAMACSFDGGTVMTCKHTDLERVCHVGAQVAPCDSF